MAGRPRRSSVIRWRTQQVSDSPRVAWKGARESRRSRSTPTGWNFAWLGGGCRSSSRTSLRGPVPLSCGGTLPASVGDHDGCRSESTDVYTLPPSDSSVSTPGPRSSSTYLLSQRGRPTEALYSIASRTFCRRAASPPGTLSSACVLEPLAIDLSAIGAFRDFGGCRVRIGDGLASRSITILLARR
jgi:hypothetical protein